MALSNLDRDLLKNCLEGSDTAWCAFCDRYLGLVVHVVTHSAEALAVPLDATSRDDLVAEALGALVERDFAVLRRFRGDSSLATFLAVVTRRAVHKRLLQRS
jgi:RNA polymerase sigma-70 factor, ECF subfamily